MHERPIGLFDTEVTIEGSTAKDVMTQRDRYLEAYPPQGYGTQFGTLYEYFRDGYTRVYGVKGRRSNTC
jgi:hypothetical protein